jgi:hypothetical protein
LFVTAGDGSFPQISTVEIYEYVEYIWVFYLLWNAIFNNS